MNRLSNKYCVLNQSFNWALKKKDIPIPFFIGKNSQTDLEIFTAVERLSISPYVNRERSYQILFASWSYRDTPAPLSRIAVCTRLPVLKSTKLNTCSPQLKSLAKLYDLYYSFNSIKKNKKKDCASAMLVRPLLDLSRGMITAVCQYGKLPVYPDRSNQSLNYSRNRIRKQILPGIQLFFNPQAEDALFQFAELVLQEQKLVSRVINTTIR